MTTHTPGAIPVAPGVSLFLILPEQFHDFKTLRRIYEIARTDYYSGTARSARPACGAFEGGGVHERVIIAIRLYRHKRTLLFVAENLAEEN